MGRGFEVLKPGLFTTIQDLGRYGYQQFGIVPTGVMDPFAFQISNRLVGNDRNEAGLEITLVGPELLFQVDCVIAICGADMGAMLEDQPAPLWKSFWMRRGQILRFSSAVKGARAYIAFAGGIDVPTVLGSKSTYVKAGMGGFYGRPLKKGDVVHLAHPNLKEALTKESTKAIGTHGRMLSPKSRPQYKNHETIRVILGPQEDRFTKEGLESFLSSVYTITPQSDRMGYRLEGPSIEHKTTADIISDAIAFGSVQVPANGKPIILMADRQTTGGYTKIGTVISADLPKVAQLKPGDTLTFDMVPVTTRILSNPILLL